MRRLTISIDIAFGKDEPEVEVDETPVGADSITERRPSDDHTDALTIGFGRTNWEN